MPTSRKAAFVIVSSDHGAMIVNRFDYHERGQTDRYGVGYEFLERSSYQAPEIARCIRLLELRREHFGGGVVAIDGGANVGAHTIAWSKAMIGWGTVIAVEAQERIFYALAGNIAVNNCFNARCVLAALAASNGEIPVPELDYAAPASFGCLELRPREHGEFIGQRIDYERITRTVPTISIDSLALPRVDLIKLDIEGMEIEALEGAADTIARHAPVLFIESAKVGRQALASLLTRFGYVFRMTPASQNTLAVHESDLSLLQGGEALDRSGAI